MYVGVRINGLINRFGFLMFMCDRSFVNRCCVFDCIVIFFFDELDLVVWVIELVIILFSNLVI